MNKKVSIIVLSLIFILLWLQSGEEKVAVSTLSLKNKVTWIKPVYFEGLNKGKVGGLGYNRGTFTVVPNSGPFTVDLYNATSVKGIASGDLIVNFEKDPKGQGENPLFWRFRLTVIDGGLIETNHTFQNEAPESGYQNTWEIGDAQYGKGKSIFSTKKIRFYMKSRGGKSYSRLQMRFMPFLKKGGVVEIYSESNTTGSRDL